MSFQDIIDHPATPLIGLGLMVPLCALALFLWFLQLINRISKPMSASNEHVVPETRAHTHENCA